MDTSVVSSLSNHCFSDRHCPVYGLLMGTVWETEKSVHLSGFIPCERKLSGLVEGKLDVSLEAKMKAFNEIYSTYGSTCIGAYCSDFSADASFSPNLFLPAEHETTGSPSCSLSVLLRIFVNNRIGTGANEHGTFLSSLSAFMIGQGNVVCTQYKTVIRIRDVLFTAKPLFSTLKRGIEVMLQENRRYFDALFGNEASSEADKFVLACSYDKYLLDVLQNDIVPRFNALEAEMKRISTFKHLVKNSVIDKIEEFKRGFPPGSIEAEEQVLKLMQQEQTNAVGGEHSPDGRICEWEEFLRVASGETIVVGGAATMGKKNAVTAVAAVPSANGKQREKEAKKFDIKKLPPEIAAALPSLIAQVKKSEEPEGKFEEKFEEKLHSEAKVQSEEKSE